MLSQSSMLQEIGVLHIDSTNRVGRDALSPSPSARNEAIQDRRVKRADRDFDLTDEQRLIRETGRRFGEPELAPAAPPAPS